MHIGINGFSKLISSYSLIRLENEKKCGTRIVLKIIIPSYYGQIHRKLNMNCTFKPKTPFTSKLFPMNKCSETKRVVKALYIPFLF